MKNLANEAEEKSILKFMISVTWGIPVIIKQKTEINDLI